MPTVSAHVAHTLAAHVDHVFGVMGNGNAWFLDALERETAVDVHRGAPRGRRRGRRRRASSAPRAGSRPRRPPTARASRTRSRRSPRPRRPACRSCSSSATSPRRVRARGTSTRSRSRRRSGRAPTRWAERMPRRRPSSRSSTPWRTGCPWCSRSPTTSPPSTPGESPRAPELRLPAAAGPDGRVRRGAVADIAPHSPARAGRCCSPDAARGWPMPARRSASSPLATGAVTASTALGRGVFPDGQYDLGVAGGFGAERAMELVRDADVAVVFGASLNQFTMRFGELFAPGTRVFQVDVAPAATHPHVGGFVRGDAAVVARRDRRGTRRARRRVLRLARDASTSRRFARTPAPVASTGSPTTAGSTRARSPAASPSCCPTTASSSPTAATSSAGRTCTGRSPRPTA